MKIYDILNLKSFIEILSDTINIAIDHGGDCGGAYFIKKDELILQVYSLLSYLKIEDKIKIIYNDGYIKLEVKK